MNLKVKRYVDSCPSLIKMVKDKTQEVFLTYYEPVTGKEKYEVVEIKSKKEWVETYSYIVDEIRTRPNKNKRVEWWEYEDQGEKRKEFLLAYRSRIRPEEKEKVNTRALNELAGAFNVPQYMAELYLNELKKSNCSSGSDLEAKNYAIALGLWE